MADIFVSYSPEDRARVEPMVLTLERAGYSVFWDAGVGPVETTTQRVLNELRGSACILVVWTHNSVLDRSTASEALHGLDMGKLVAARYDQAPAQAPFNTMGTIDLDHWAGDPNDPAWRRLVDQVDAAVARSRGTAPAPPQPSQQPYGGHPQPQPQPYGAPAQPQPYGLQPPHYGSHGGHPAYGQPAGMGLPHHLQPSYDDRIGLQRDFSYFYFSVRGRISLGEVWLYWMLPNIGIILGLLMIIGLVAADGNERDAGAAAGILFLLYLVVTFWPSIAVTIKRLHDIGWTGVLILLALIPIGNIVILIVSLFVPGDRGANRFGPDPRDS